MRKSLLGILQGQLTLEHWKWILTILCLSLFMIYCSHKTDQKVYRKAILTQEVRSLKSSYIEFYSKLMNLKKQSVIEIRVKKIGLKVPEYPPRKIIIVKNAK